jgi:hypothetical protein
MWIEPGARLHGARLALSADPSVGSRHLFLDAPLLGYRAFCLLGRSFHAAPYYFVSMNPAGRTLLVPVAAR